MEEEKRKNILKTRNSVKIREIQSNFKNAKRVSISRESECPKREKRVMFLEPPKEMRMRNNKKTQVILNPNLLKEQLHTEIEQAISKKKKKKKRISLKKTHSSNNIIKMPVLKTKVVNINTHFYLPLVHSFKPKTLIMKNNPLKGQKDELKLKRNSTFDKNLLKRKSEELNDNIRKIKINSKKESKKDIVKRNTEENGRLYENPYAENKINQIPIDPHSRYNVKNPENEMKKMRSNSKGENTSNTGINEINKEEDIKEINDNNKINENDDNLTDKINIHKKNNSVDAKKEKKNMNDSYIKKLFCCLNG
jgi:hypothetical protein